MPRHDGLSGCAFDVFKITMVKFSLYSYCEVIFVIIIKDINILFIILYATVKHCLSNFHMHTTIIPLIKIINTT